MHDPCRGVTLALCAADANVGHALALQNNSASRVLSSLARVSVVPAFHIKGQQDMSPMTLVQLRVSMKGALLQELLAGGCF